MRNDVSIDSRCPMPVRSAHAAQDILFFVGKTNLEVLVAGLLVLLGHGRGVATGEVAEGAEDDTGGSNTKHDVHEDLGALTGRGLGARTVGTESNPVGWSVQLASSP